MRITEKRLRSVIRNIIKESHGQDLSSPEDLAYLSDMGIDSLEDAIAHSMQGNTSTNEAINRLMYRVIKESANDDQKLMNAANLINNQITDDSQENLQAAADKLSELKNEANTKTRMRIIVGALAILGLSAMLAPIVLFVIAGFAGVHSAVGAGAMAILGKMGTIGAVISMAAGATSAQRAIDLEGRYL